MLVSDDKRVCEGLRCGNIVQARRYNVHFFSALQSGRWLDRYCGEARRPLRTAQVLHPIPTFYIHFYFHSWSLKLLLCLSISLLSKFTLPRIPFVVLLQLAMYFVLHRFSISPACRSQQTALWELISTELAFIRTLKVIQDVSQENKPIWTLNNEHQEFLQIDNTKHCLL